MLTTCKPRDILYLSSERRVYMSRKKLKNYDDKEDVKNLSQRERALSKMFGLIFHLNNNQIRYSMEYKGYEFILKKYDFAKKEWNEVSRKNFTQISYADSYRYVRDINAKLYNELCEFALGIECEWEDEDE